MAAPKMNIPAMRDGIGIPAGKPASVRQMLRAAGKKGKRSPVRRAADDPGDHEYR